MDFTEIWNEAYNVLADNDTSMMWEFLFDQVSKGNITAEDASVMGDDIIDTYNL